MNRLTTLALTIGGIAGLVWLEETIRRDADLRYSLAWALRVWVEPPDRDAYWEQNHSRRPAWQRRP